MLIPIKGLSFFEDTAPPEEYGAIKESEDDPAELVSELDLDRLGEDAGEVEEDVEP